MYSFFFLAFSSPLDTQGPTNAPIVFLSPTRLPDLGGHVLFDEEFFGGGR